ncbi:hypothetical protein SAMN02910262_00525 [[Clostridium] aminophilum]|uniref:Uncharacterized protein n=1 Tax=[Clostridium] aminophilum TaxID=1526 RepID=A0A1I6ILL2_9FIRM|nr:hypothetical protein SAMN02910262_00525 [[Clostridium] aminophilum]
MLFTLWNVHLKEEQIYCFLKLFAKHTFYEKMCYNRILEVKP